MLTSNFVFADTRQTTYVIAKINNNRTAYTKIININMLQLKGKPFKNSRLFTGAVISDSVYFEQTSINSNTDVQIHTIVAINTTEKIGGPAIAASRLMEALKNNGIKAKLLVRDKQTEQITVVQLNHNLRMVWKFVWERIVIWKANHFNKKHHTHTHILGTHASFHLIPMFSWSSSGETLISVHTRIVYPPRRSSDRGSPA